MPEAGPKAPQPEVTQPKAELPESKGKALAQIVKAGLKNGANKTLKFLAEKADGWQLKKDPAEAVYAAIDGKKAGINAVAKLLKSNDATIAEFVKFRLLDAIAKKQQDGDYNDLGGVIDKFPDLMAKHAEMSSLMVDPVQREKLLADARAAMEAEAAALPKATEMRTVAEAQAISSALRPAREKYRYLEKLADGKDGTAAQAPMEAASVDSSPQVVSEETTPVAQKEIEKIPPEVRSAVVDSLGVDFLNTLDHVEEGLDQQPTLQDFASYLRALRLINEADTSLSPTQRATKDKALRNLVYQMNIGGTAANESEGGFVYANHTPGEIVKYMRENSGNVHLYSDLSAESGSDEVGKLNELIAEGGLLAQAAADKKEIRKVILQAKELVEKGISNEKQAQAKVKLTAQESEEVRRLRNLRDQGMLTPEQVANFGGFALDVSLGMDDKYELLDEEQEKVPALV